MAYNNSFPIGYQPTYMPQQQAYIPQMSPTQMSGTSPQSNGIIWVQGEGGAKSYMVAPNTTVQLWDSEDQVIYLKSADASGMPTMKILDYKIRDAGNSTPPVALQGNYVTREELAAFEDKVLKLIGGDNDGKSDF